MSECNAIQDCRKLKIKTRQFTYNVTICLVRVTVVAMDTQQYGPPFSLLEYTSMVVNNTQMFITVMEMQKWVPFALL